MLISVGGKGVFQTTSTTPSSTPSTTHPPPPHFSHTEIVINYSYTEIGNQTVITSCNEGRDREKKFYNLFHTKRLHYNVSNYSSRMQFNTVCRIIGQFDYNSSSVFSADVASRLKAQWYIFIWSEEHARKRCEEVYEFV